MKNGKKFLIFSAIAAAVVGLGSKLLSNDKTRKDLIKIKDDVGRLSCDINKMVEKEIKKVGRVINKEKYDQIVAKVISEYGEKKVLAEELKEKVETEVKSKWQEIKSKFDSKDVEDIEKK
ncbi:MAG: hypothetical protein PHS07_02665 [Patescibacteria group bacterium]|nr:hypothetical protein [Patescibacteria group bacterium]